MRYFVNENCIGCGLCAGTCPEVFEMTGAGVAHAMDVDTDLDAAVDAMESCPAAAIEEV